MRTTKTYSDGCKWCNGKGFVPTTTFGMGTTPLTEVCPVCHGSKVITVTETIEDDKPDKE